MNFAVAFGRLIGDYAEQLVGRERRERVSQDDWWCEG